MVSPSYAEVPGRVSVSGEFECGLIDAFRRVHDGQIGRRRTHGTAAFAVGEQLFCGLVEAVAVTFVFPNDHGGAVLSSTRAFFS